ncbi:beta-L-arabinofuranosidase domain-containing protein [Allomuricauda sp. SCSIO 65647]|uniref:beta-L-arabinofuranosidase domain-containing protein n=1 Tax=Allomuricauda sp. SCSIO 65647 TaxID=2908843 RepID=UPI001F26298A|nr:beta-L-arabinofuranosidase domain-containing protein [Muricauda sp. SCSIO 65647]UJH67845.1 glycoside hydrolase family 127 protein [Muricauda sp. SCSIO 65647]
MKVISLISLCLLLSLSCNNTKETDGRTDDLESATLYLQNRSPLKPMAYLELPLGSIKPEGWLKEQLKYMANGMTGNLDSIYPEVVGPRNGWLGGDGDGWERGPYWIDGLLPLAYILEDEALKEKTRPWVEWALNNQTDEGYIGPVPFETEPGPERGLQRGNRKDWWPKMVMLKVLQQYYDATGDERVIDVLTKYFKYQLKELPNRPLDHLTLWANRRGADNLQVVYWLYNITGDDFLLDLGEIIQEQTFPWTTIFTNKENYNDPTTPWHYTKLKRYPFDSTEINDLTVSKLGGIHTVNLAQGLKAPVIYYQKSHEQHYVEAVKKALKDIKKYHGQPQGMYGGDEPLHGTNPVQGVEFCSISEGMFSLESIIKITGDMEFADLLERIAYNALPPQASDDFTTRQYFQAANQIELSDRLETSFQTNSHKGTDFVFGTLSGYPCCTTNMHQSWPKFVQNLFYATPDGGAAALMYAPAKASLLVADSVNLTITETTGFPFKESVDFEFSLDRVASFPFHLRIPSWSKNAEILVNGNPVEVSAENQIAVIERQWQSGDKVTLKMPMTIKTSIWHEFSTAVERGPLVYALKVTHEERKKDRGDIYREFNEVYATSDWNYGLIQSELDKLPESAQIIENEWDGRYPWNLENAPLEIRLTGVKVPEWKEVNGAPVFPGFWDGYYWDGDYGEGIKKEKIVLVPYGCTTLRITEFPTYNLK